MGDSPEKLDDTSHGSTVGLLGFPWVPLFLGDLLSLLALPVIPLNSLLVHLDLAPLSLGYVFP